MFASVIFTLSSAFALLHTVLARAAIMMIVRPGRMDDSRRIGVGVFMALLLFAAPNAQGQSGEGLFERVPATSLSETQQRVYNRIAAQPTTASIQMVRVRVDRLAEQQRVHLNVSETDVLKIDRGRLEQRSADDYSWIGVLGDLMNHAHFVVRSGRVTGSIRIEGRLYQLRPLPGAGHALIQVDEAALPPTDPEGLEGGVLKSTGDEQIRIPQEGAAPAPATEDLPVIDIIVAYTSDAVDMLVDAPAAIQLAIDETNITYENSNIQARVRLALAYETPTRLQESFNDLERFLTPGDGYFDEVHGLRSTYGADIAMLVGGRGQNFGFCGVANLIYADEPDEAFAITAGDCLTGSYVFGHEVGHLQGARHNPEADPTTTPFAYGHGKTDTENGFRTVMAYNDADQCPDGNCTRVPFWSSPDVTYDGIATGDTEERHNTRVLNATAPLIADYQASGGAVATFDVAPLSLQGEASETLTTTLTNTSPDAVLNWSIGQKQEERTPPAGDQGPYAYVWQDSRDAEGPAFAWRDISTTGTPLSFAEDARAEVALPFDVSFYDQTHNTAYVSPNGALTFASGTSLPEFNRPVVTGEQRSMLAPFWDAIDLSAGGAVYAGMSETEWFVVQWENVRRVDGDGPYTFQVLIHPDGQIRYQYKEMTGSVTSATVGIADAAGTGGVQVTHNSSYLEDNLAIDFAVGTQWLNATPQAGTLFPSEQREVTVGFAPQGLPLGTYRGTLRFMAENPSTASVAVPVTFDFSGARIGGIAFRDGNRNGERDASESILNGIEVELIEDTNANGQRDPGEPVVGTQTTSQSGTSTTAQPGRYRFIGVDPGTYLVRYVANRGSALILNPTTASPQAITVAENENITDVDVGLASVEQLYVNADAASGGDGLTWQTALRDLDVALRGAVGETEVWVAEGAYTPPGTDTSFRITSAQDGMQVYGGFQGVETHRDQRDPDRYPTVLSGDIGRNDQVDARGVTRTTGDWSGTNVRHVLYLDGSYSSTGITPATVVDGMIITAGGSGALVGGGIRCEATQGMCSPTIRNVDFIANRANYGAAFFMGARAGGTSSPTITGSAFENNRAADSGGAIGSGGLVYNCRGTLTLREVTFSGNVSSTGLANVRNLGGALFLDDTCEAEIAQATFIGNRATDSSGAIHAQGSGALTLTGVTFADNYTEGNGGGLRIEGTRTAALTNVAFLGNRSDALGGAIYTGGSSDVTLNIVGATFTGNESSFGGALYNDGRSSGEKTVSFANTILWDNQGNGSDIWNAGDGATVVIDHTIVQADGVENEGSASLDDLGTNTNANPQFIDADGADNVIGTLDDNVRVAATSPARDAGTGSAIPDGIATDLAGNPRIQDDDGDGAARVDIGAYEGNLAPSIPNQALTFNGIDTYIGADGVADALAGAEAFTVEAWVYPTESGGQQGLATFHNATGGNRNLLLYRDGQFQYYDGTTGYKLSRNAFPPGQWYHVAFTVDASNAATLYVNGRREATFTTSVRPEAGGRFSIGQEWDGGPTAGDFFEGRIDEMRVWGMARTQADVQDGMTVSLEEENTLGDTFDLANLVAHYRFEGNAADYTGLYPGETAGTASYTDDVAPATATDALVVRVNAAAPASGSSNGTSWDDAHTALQAALRGAGPRNELWVAGGTYTPVVPADPANVTTAEREASFRITGDQDGLQVYGGFAGGETERAQRQGAANPTVLSGDIGGEGDASDNSYHVVVFDGGNAMRGDVDANITAETVLDGVTITAGNANGNFPDLSGGGLYCDGSGTNGAGAGNACSPTLTDVQFIGNAARFGGAIYSIASGGGASHMQIARASFFENDASESGGAIYFAGDNGSIATRVVNSVFVDNTASHIGFDDGNAGQQPQFIHSTFTGASEQAVDVFYYDTGQTPIQAINSVFWNNGPGGIAGSSGSVAEPDAAVAVRYSIVEEARYTTGTDGASNTQANPRFADADAPLGPDGVFGTSDDGLRLQPTSPAIALGTYAPFEPGGSAEQVTTDLTGQARRFGLFPDLGPYELHQVASTQREIVGATGLSGYIEPSGFGGLLLLRDAVDGDLVFTRTEVRPESPDLPAGVAPVTWTVDASLSAAPTYDLVLDVSSVPGIEAFDQLLLYTSRDGGATWNRVTDLGGTLVLSEDRQLVAVQDLTGFSQFAVASSNPGNPLPVELAGLEAQRAGPDAVTVQWETLSERNNARFEVQRQVRSGSAPQTNAASAVWETVAHRDGAGTTDVPQRYRAEDTALPYAADSLAYRLRQVDTDGTESFSEAVTIARPVIGAELLPTYPNPARGQATVRFAIPERQAVRITLYDILGRRIRTVVDADLEGRHEQTLDVGRLASGTYFIWMQTEDGVVDTQRITVVR